MKSASEIAEDIEYGDDDIEFLQEELENDVKDAIRRGKTRTRFYPYPCDAAFRRVKTGLLSRRIDVVDERIKKILDEAGYTVSPCYFPPWDFVMISWDHTSEDTNADSNDD